MQRMTTVFKVEDVVNPRMTLEASGFPGVAEAHYNLLEPALMQAAIARGEGALGQRRRLPGLDRPPHRPQPQGQVRRPRAFGRAARLVGEQRRRWRPRPSTGCSPTCSAHVRGGELFVQDLYAGADPDYRLNVRVITELAWHGLFIRHLLRRPSREELKDFVPGFTILNCPSFKADPARHGCRSETVIAISFEQKLILIGGTAYAGENKKCGLHRAELPAARAGGDADALLGEPRARRRGRRRDLLRALGHRQDHALGRPGPGADRRRRARLVRPRHLQLRGRLLRQDDQPLARGRARDLRDHQPLRHRRREHGLGPGHPRARLRRRQPDGEHPLRLPARGDLERERRPRWAASRRTS